MRHLRTALIATMSVTVLLAGCASSGSGTHGTGAAGGDSTTASSTAETSTSAAVLASTLSVHVGIFGGPLLPNGNMAASNAPQVDDLVKVVDASGRRWTAKTGKNGVATLTVPAGRYTITSTTCGFPQHAVVVAGVATHVNIHCDVP